MNPFQLPQGRGRPKGSQNKLTTDLKAMIRQALENAGGVEYLTVQAEANPKAFLTLLGRTLPMDIDVTNKSINVSIAMYSNEPHLIEHNEQSQFITTRQADEGVLIQGN